MPEAQLFLEETTENFFANTNPARRGQTDFQESKKFASQEEENIFLSDKAASQKVNEIYFVDLTDPANEETNNNNNNDAKLRRNSRRHVERNENLRRRICRYQVVLWIFSISSTLLAALALTIDR